MKGNIKTEEGIIDYAHKTAVSSGRVIDVHPEYRDKGMLNFPSFQTDARFDGGMSGGPIFDKTGNVCGVVCSSMEGNGEEKSYISYGSLIWPIFGCFIEIAIEPAAPVKPILLYDLVKIKAIATDKSFDRIDVETKEDGRRSVRLLL